MGYEAYDSLANAVWSETYRYESEVNLKNRLLKMYNEERQAYEQMYGEMIGLRAKIYDSLGWMYDIENQRLFLPNKWSMNIFIFHF